MMLVFVTIAGASCTSSRVSSSPASEPLIPGSYVEIGPAKGEVSVLRVLGIPFGDTETPDQRAIDQAIARSGGDALVKISITEKKCGLCLVSKQTTRVKGTAVKKNE